MTSPERAVSSAVDMVNTGGREKTTALIDISLMDSWRVSNKASFSPKGGGDHLLSMYLVPGVCLSTKEVPNFLYIGS